MTDRLLEAVDAALEGDWERAHGIVQQFDSPLAFRIHAVLHKSEGDVANSRYWYALTRIFHHEGVGGRVRPA